MNFEEHAGKSILRACGLPVPEGRVCASPGAAAQAADYIAGMRKPVVAFNAGRAAPTETKMGHAGAIVSGNKGTYQSKRAALQEAGAQVVDVPSQVAQSLSDCLPCKADLTGKGPHSARAAGT